MRYNRTKSYLYIIFSLVEPDVGLPWLNLEYLSLQQTHQDQDEREEEQSIQRPDYSHELPYWVHYLYYYYFREMRGNWDEKIEKEHVEEVLEAEASCWSLDALVDGFPSSYLQWKEREL